MAIEKSKSVNEFVEIFICGVKRKFLISYFSNANETKSEAKLFNDLYGKRIRVGMKLNMDIHSEDYEEEEMSFILDITDKRSCFDSLTDLHSLIKELDIDLSYPNDSISIILYIYGEVSHLFKIYFHDNLRKLMEHISTYVNSNKIIKKLEAFNEQFYTELGQKLLTSLVNDLTIEKFREITSRLKHQQKEYESLFEANIITHFLKNDNTALILKLLYNLDIEKDELIIIRGTENLPNTLLVSLLNNGEPIKDIGSISNPQQLVTSKQLWENLEKHAGGRKIFVQNLNSPTVNKRYSIVSFDGLKNNKVSIANLTISSSTILKSPQPNTDKKERITQFLEVATETEIEQLHSICELLMKARGSDIKSGFKK